MRLLKALLLFLAAQALLGAGLLLGVWWAGGDRPAAQFAAACASRDGIAITVQSHDLCIARRSLISMFNEGPLT